MEKKEYYKSQQIKTIGELKEKLKDIPDHYRITSSDTDIGGYDTSQQKHITMTMKKNRVLFGHLERKAWDDYEKGNITYREFNSLFPS